MARSREDDREILRLALPAFLLTVVFAMGVPALLWKRMVRRTDDRADGDRRRPGNRQ